jgi:uncharacterized YccA/Bax inhibitor family protein
VATRKRTANRGSFGSAANYSRLIDTFGRAGTSTVAVAPAPAPPGWHRDDTGQWYRWNGAQWQPTAAPPTGMAPVDVRPPVSDAPPFTVAGVFDKVGIMLGLAVAAGVVAYVAKLPLGAVWVALLCALVVGLVTAFVPRTARVLAPVYAVLEGAVLGVISGWYAQRGQFVVAVAVVGTAAIVLGVWAVYRSGLVRVGHRFVQATMVASLGLLAAMVVAILTNLSFSGLGGFVIFGVLYLIIAVMNLFVDFDYAVKAQQAGVSKQGEWYSAFSIMLSTMMVYLALLRILGGGRR